MAEQDPRGGLLGWVRGAWATPRQLWKTFWDDQGVKHDPEDTESPDWANSEPDPDAP